MMKGLERFVSRTKHLLVGVVAASYAIRCAYPLARWSLDPMTGATESIARPTLSMEHPPGRELGRHDGNWCGRRDLERCML